MTRFALSIGLGPVGSFIAAGRRSRDLWWGSTWLSECTLLVAAHLHRIGKDNGWSVEVLLPSQRRQLFATSATINADGGLRDYGGRVSNHIRALAAVPDEARLKALIAEVEVEAHGWLATKLEDAAARASEALGRQGLSLDDVRDKARFARQVVAVKSGDFIRFSAAWAPVGPDADDALRRADALLSRALSVRAFSAPTSTAGARKSDLDPGRDGVLIEGDPGLSEARAILGIRPAEQLDAISFARRIAVFAETRGAGAELGRLPFPPLSRVAIDPWLKRADADPSANTLLHGLKRDLLLQLRHERRVFLSWCTPSCDPDKKADQPLDEHLFPFDAALLFEDGIEALAEEARRNRLHGVERAVRSHAGRVAELHRLLGAPNPYYALVEADGDGLGDALKAARGRRYGELVERLDRYADGLREALLQHHGGRAFYVGGDDALYVVPLPQLLPSLSRVSTLFVDTMNEPSFTLSAGVAIAHIKDDLRGVRREASKAIRSAKDARRDELCAARGSGRALAPRGWVELRELPRAGASRRVRGPTEALGCSSMLGDSALSRETRSWTRPRSDLRVTRSPRSSGRARSPTPRSPRWWPGSANGTMS